MLIRSPEEDDRDAWGALFAGYLAFYKAELPLAVVEHTFRRIVDQRSAIYGLVAEDEETGALLGLTHFIFHPSSWSPTGYCYLEDLFVAPEGRGKGVGRALIEAVEAAAREAEATRFYWVTQQDNATARRLYDALVPVSDFVQYRKAL